MPGMVYDEIGEAVEKSVYKISILGIRKVQRNVRTSFQVVVKSRVCQISAAHDAPRSINARRDMDLRMEDTAPTCSIDPV